MAGARRFGLLLVPVLAVSLPAHADTRDDVMARAARCAAITDGRQWLDCYYAAAQPLRTELGLAPAPQAGNFNNLFARPVPAPAAPPPAAEDDSDGLFGGIFGGPQKVALGQFGFKNAKPGRGVNVDRVVAHMAGYDLSGRSFTVTLDNGQVWKQLAGDPGAPHWNKPAATYAVVIAYGALGTFNLRVTNDSTDIYKVSRVK